MTETFKKQLHIFITIYQLKKINFEEILFDNELDEEVNSLIFAFLQDAASLIRHLSTPKFPSQYEV